MGICVVRICTEPLNTMCGLVVCSCWVDLGPAVTGTFLNTLKFNVKDCDPTTGEPDDDEGPGYEDEYVVSVGGWF